MKCAAPRRLIGANGLRASGPFLGPVLGLALGVMAGAAGAQSNGPAETPPADFTGAQFIDSAGCAFARAAINGQTRWVPRLDPDRQPVCGLTPSLTPSLADAADTPAPAAPAAPGRADDTDTADVPAPDAATPARTAAATPAPAPAPATATATATPRPQAPHRTATPAAPARAAPALPESIPAGDMTGIPTVPCPAHYPQRGVICVEQRVFQQIVAARAAGAAGAAMPDLTGTPQAGAEGRFVQIGAFAVPANAQRTLARLREQGLPPQSRRVRHQGRMLELVYAGPFDSAETLQAALRTARALGFADAYIR